MIKIFMEGGGGGGMVNGKGVAVKDAWSGVVGGFEGVTTPAPLESFNRTLKTS